MLTPRNELRRCARCGQSALVVTHEWNQRVLGFSVPSEPVLELRCRACSVVVTLEPRLNILIHRAYGYLFLPAIFPSIYFFAVARRMERPWLENPVVGTTEVPAAEVLSTLPRRYHCRRCFCGSPANLIEVAIEGTMKTDRGRRYEYQCSECSRRFAVHSTRYLVTSSIASLLLAVVGTLLITYPPGTAAGAADSNRWFGVGLVGIAFVLVLLVFFGIQARRLHTPV